MTKREPTKFEENWKISSTKRAGQADCHKTNKKITLKELSQEIDCNMTLTLFFVDVSRLKND